MRLWVVSLIHGRFPIETSEVETVADVKKFTKKWLTDNGVLVPKTQQISYKGALLKDVTALTSLGTTEGDHLLFLYDLKTIPDEPQVEQTTDISVTPFTMDAFVQDIVSALRHSQPNQDRISTQENSQTSPQPQTPQTPQTPQQPVQPSQPAQETEQEEPEQEPEQEGSDLHLASLVSMGFPESRSRRALLINGMNVEAALNWLLENADAPDPPSTQEARIFESLQQMQRENQSNAKKIEKCIGDKKCTFTVTGKDYAPQCWYHCYSCGLVDSEGVCESCAVVCHKGHKLSEKKESGSFYCDCGAGAYNCLCNK